MKNILSSWRKPFLVFLIILFLGFLLRIYNLTLLPVFADEAIYVRWSQIMSSEPTLRFLPLSDGKQPLYMWVLMFAVKRFSDPLFIGRLLSVFAGLASIVGIFSASLLLFKNKKVSLIASLLWAVSPFSIFFDRLALVDALLASLGIWTFFFWLLTVKTLRFDFAMITGFFLGAAFLTKSPAVFFALLLPSAFLIADFPKDKKSKIFVVVKLSWYLIAGLGIALGMYNILRLGPNFHLIGARNQDYVFPLTQVLTNPLDPFKFHIEQVFSDWLVKIGPFPILALAFLGIISGIQKFKRETLLLIIWFLVPVLIQSEYAKVFTARYILYTIPYLFILASLAFASDKANLIKLATLVLIIFIALSAKENYFLLANPARANLPSSERSGYLEEWTAGHGIKEISEFLKNEAAKLPGNGRIVVGTEGYFGTLPDGLQMYMEGIQNVTVIGVGLSIKEIPEPLAESKKAGNPTYLVINKSRLIAKNPESAGFKLIAAYPKPERRETESREYKLHGPQEVLYLFEVVK